MIYIYIYIWYIGAYNNMEVEYSCFKEFFLFPTSRNKKEFPLNFFSLIEKEVFSGEESLAKNLL